MGKIDVDLSIPHLASPSGREYQLKISVTVYYYAVRLISI